MGRPPAKNHRALRLIKRLRRNLQWLDGNMTVDISFFGDEIVRVDGSSLAEGTEIKYFWKPEKEIYNGIIVGLQLLPTLTKVSPNESEINTELLQETNIEEDISDKTHINTELSQETKIEEGTSDIPDIKS